MQGTAVHKAMWAGRARIFAFFVLALLVAASIGVLLAAKPAHADTFNVNSTGDDGDAAPSGVCNTAPFPPGTEPECTLRAAIEEANATTAADTINFNIGGSGVKTITTNDSLPSITITQPVTINGYSEPGASENTLAVGNNAVLLIRLDGAFANRTGLEIEAGGSGSVVRGLSITRFTTALNLSGVDNNTIEGNFIGTDPSGTQKALGSSNGVIIGVGESNTQSENNTLGGTSPGARNIISGNRDGVFIGGTGTTGNKVMGNYIGTTKSGTGDLGNQDGGVFIGTPAGNTIGDDNPNDGLTNAANIIAFNGGPGGSAQANEGGVRITNDTATGNTILSNSIFSNSGLGIDLGGSGVTLNDGPGDPDFGPNNLQNYPLITSAKTGGKTTIQGTLESSISETFTIQFFKNPKGTREEGKKFIGEQSVTDTDGDGIISFTFQPQKKVKAGLFVTATATNTATRNTSEFSAPKKVRG